MSSERPSPEPSEEGLAHDPAPARELPDVPVPSHGPRAVSDAIRAVSDAIRAGADVALSATGAVVLSRHADVVTAAHDLEVFSSAVSRVRQLPDGLDGADHAAFRGLTDPYFAPGRMAALEPVLRGPVPRGGPAVTGHPPTGAGPGASGSPGPSWRGSWTRSCGSTTPSWRTGGPPRAP